MSTDATHRLDLLTRRSLLTGAAAGAAMAGIGGNRAGAEASATVHRFAVGAAEITVIADGIMTLPLAFAFPAVTQAEASHVLAAGGLPDGAVNNAVNVAIVKTGTDVILIDTGAGGDFMPGLGKFADAFERAGFKPEDITKVVFTHAHPDHLWGIIDPLDDGTRFPNAEHFMSAKEFDTWNAPDIEARVGGPFKAAAAGTKRRLKLIAERLTMRRAGDEIAPGVTLLGTPGHTPGHVSVLVTSNGAALLIGGDVLTHSIVSFQKPAWVWGPDMDAATAVATRGRTLDMLANDRIPLLGYHMPWPGLGRVERAAGAYRYLPA